MVNSRYVVKGLSNIREDFLIKRWPISDATVQGSCMNEVKAFFAKDPWFSEIVYFEVQIGRYQRRLCGTKICSKYLFLLLWYCATRGHVTLTSADGYLSAKSLFAS